jgi:phenylpyruvate tautomerase PptA (4-oxalocrotonate tautomerase family)
VPILRVCVVGQQDIAADAAQRVADGAGRIFQTPPGSTWVVIESLPQQQYAENAVQQPPQPVFVRLLMRRGTSDLLAGQVQLLCELICANFNVPVEHVHVLVEPAARGRVYFGGRPLE